MGHSRVHPRRHVLLAALGGAAGALVSACSGAGETVVGGSPVGRDAASTGSRHGLDAAAGQTRASTLPTTHLPSGSADCLIALPKSLPAKGLVLVLHGAGHTAQSAFDELGLAPHAQESGLAIAAVSGDNTWWHPRPGVGDGLHLVTDDLLPAALATAELPPSTRVGLLGYSMGGYGALLVGATLGPKRVRGIVAQAPALFDDPRQAGHAFSSATDFEDWSINEARRAVLRTIPVWIDCGEQDYFIDVSRELAADLPRAHTTFRPGDHDTAVWKPLVGEELRWLLDQPA